MWGRIEARGVAGPGQWYRRNDSVCPGGCCEVRKERTRSSQEEAWQGWRAVPGSPGQQRARRAEKGGPGGGLWWGWRLGLCGGLR